MRRVGVIGWYGHGNVGDDALLYTIYNLFKVRLPELDVVIVADNPESLQSQFGVASIETIPLSFKCLARRWSKMYSIIFNWWCLDALVLGGGGFFADDGSRKNVLKWSLYIVLARLMGLRIFAYCIGVGPLRHKTSRIFARFAFSLVDTIIVRDEESCNCLLQTGLNKDITVAVDPVVNLEITPTDILALLEKVQLTSDDAFVAIAIPPYFHDEQRWPGQQKKWQIFCQSWAHVVDEIIAWGMTPLFVPMQHCPPDYSLFSDIDAAEKIINLTQKPHLAKILYQPLNTSEAAAIFAKAELVLAMRLHAIILAVTAGAPVAGAIYHHKVKELVKRLSLDTYFVDVIGLSPNILLATVRHAWADRLLISSTIANHLPQLKAQAQKAEDILVLSMRSSLN